MVVRTLPLIPEQIQKINTPRAYGPADPRFRDDLESLRHALEKKPSMDALLEMAERVSEMAIALDGDLKGLSKAVARDMQSLADCAKADIQSVADSVEALSAALTHARDEARALALAERERVPLLIAEAVRAEREKSAALVVAFQNRLEQLENAILVIESSENSARVVLEYVHGQVQELVKASAKEPEAAVVPTEPAEHVPSFSVLTWILMILSLGMYRPRQKTNLETTP